AMLRSAGYEPGWKDWDSTYDGEGGPPAAAGPRAETEPAETRSVPAAGAGLRRPTDEAERGNRLTS
ncbi:MAG: hypothetical protein ACREFX_06080, partial [Opitutaceae bacterium]